jgi:hypothetical protein
MRASIAEAELYATVFEPAFKHCVDESRQTRAFSAATVCQACEEGLAQHLQESVIDLRAMLNTLAQPSSASSELSTVKLNANPPALPAGPSPATDSHAREHAAGMPTSSDTARSSTNPADTTDVVAHTWVKNGAALETLTAQVRRFAVLAGVGDCVSLEAKAPRGYLMQALSDVDLHNALKRRAWGLLVMISGQPCGSAREVLPQSTVEVHGGAHAVAIRSENNPDSLPTIDQHFVEWLLDMRDEAAGAFCGIVAMVRDLPPAAEFLATSESISQLEAE